MNNSNVIMNRTHWQVDVLSTIDKKIVRESMSYQLFNEKGIDIESVLTGPYEKGTNREFYCFKNRGAK